MYKPGFWDQGTRPEIQFIQKQLTQKKRKRCSQKYCREVTVNTIVHSQESEISAKDTEYVIDDNPRPAAMGEKIDPVVYDVSDEMDVIITTKQKLALDGTEKKLSSYDAEVQHQIIEKVATVSII